MNSLPLRCIPPGRWLSLALFVPLHSFPLFWVLAVLFRSAESPRLPSLGDDARTPNGLDDPHITDDGEDAAGPRSEPWNGESETEPGSPVKVLEQQGQPTPEPVEVPVPVPVSDGVELLKPDTVVLANGTEVLAPMSLMGLE